MGILIFISICLLGVMIKLGDGGNSDNYWIAGDIGGSGGGSGSRTDSKSSQTTNTTASAQESQLNDLDFELRKAAQDGLLNVQNLGLMLSGKMLAGEDLPGYMSGLPGGISPEVTQDIVDKSLEDVATSAQFSGILDSGIAGELATGAAADVRTQSEQFNLENLMQLLNLAVGGQAIPVSSAAGFGSTLGQRLSGLRSEVIGQKGRSTTFSGQGEMHASTS